MSSFSITPANPAARLGLKGPEAAALLQQAGIPVPASANRILQGSIADGSGTWHVRVLRLGNTEFVLESDDGDAALANVQSLALRAGLRAWPVIRADCSLILGGSALFDRLSRVCAFDFTQLAAQPDLAVMTLLAEISVTFALEPRAVDRDDSTPRLRLWADPGFATYLTQSLKSLSLDAPTHGVHA